ncbi:MAG: AAA family ATPase [Promethearchaeota archaeon]|jgi:MoxR-like ATPase
MAKKPSINKSAPSKSAPKKQQTQPALKSKSTSTQRKPKSKKAEKANSAKTPAGNLEILKNSPYLKGSAKSPTSKKQLTLKELFEKNMLSHKEEKMEIVLSGQYQEALDLMYEADASNLYPILVGPPGIGKTTICRYYAQSRAEITGNDSFEWITFDESTKPAHLIGSFNPATTIQKGFSFEAFNPGPLIKAMLHGGVFLANEVNRATEYTQNSLLEPLEEKTLSIPHIGRVKSSAGFFFIGAMNPSELVGTHRLGEALKDRFNVWIELDYPDKKTEMKIIKHNNPYYKVDESTLEKIYLIINRTRTHHQIQTPASLRSGIALARLTGVAKKKTKKDPNKILKEIARNVLFGAIQTKPGVKTNDVIKNIISQVVGTV